jgi:hypothetical protein
MERTFFAYHLTHFFGSFSVDSYHTNSENPREDDLLYVVSGDDADTGGKDYFLEGLFRIHRRHLGPFNLSSLNGKPTPFMYRLSLVPVRVPRAPIPMLGQSWYDRKEVHRYFSSGQNFNSVNADYKIRFDGLLTAFDYIPDETVADLEAISNRADLAPTTREALVKARLGQGKFRSDLVSLWGKGEICVLTGVDTPELLTASHIKPWRSSDDTERLDPCNGILLVAHVDRAFDQNLLSFFESPNGEFAISIHPRLLRAFKATGVTQNSRLATNHMNITQSRKFSAYMNEHYRLHQELLETHKPT